MAEISSITDGMAWCDMAPCTLAFETSIVECNGKQDGAIGEGWGRREKLTDFAK
jgi:hypothetical protein